VKYLLDTHVVLWLLMGERDALGPGVVEEIGSPRSTPYVSAASVWEIAIKRSLGKVVLEDRWLNALLSLELEHLPVTAHHAAAVEDLPWHHRDPFDRLLVAQAVVEGCTLVTSDAALTAYGIPILWG